MTAPAAFGVREFTSADSEVEQHAENIRVLGYTIVPGVLSGEELERARTGIDDVYQRQVDEVGGEDKLEAIGDAHTARALLAYDDFFLRLATAPEVLEVVKQFLGDYFVLMLQNGIINAPAVGHQQNAGAWHRDLNYQHFTSSRPLSISALHCIDPFRAETGATHFLPATHKMEPFPSDAFVQRNEQPVEAEPGSVIVFDSMAYHRSGLNTSGAVRRAVNHMYTAAFVKQQISFPKMLDGRFSDDPALAKLLGYESETDPSVREFRLRRIARAQR